MSEAAGSGRSATVVGLYDERHEQFRADVRSVLDGWSEEDFARWDTEGHVPREVFRELGASGAFRRRWADGRFGGLPFALVMAEEVAPLSGGLGVALTVHGEVFIATLAHGASSDYHRSVLEGALDGELIGCFAATDRRGGSDLPGVSLTATREGDGWRLSGHKCYISNAGRATHVIMLARAPERDPGRDLGLFLLPLDAVNVVGFFPKLGTEACDAALIEVDTVVGDEAVVGAIGTGLVYANVGLQLERVSGCALALAAARAALGLAIAHARRRQVAGGLLIKKQAVRHRLAEMWAEMAELETFLHAVVAAGAAGRNVSREIAALKLRGPRLAGRVADECVQILGARGYTRNYPLERLLRDVRIARLGAGTDDVMCELIASGLDRRDRHFDAWLDRLDEADRPVPDLEAVAP